MSFSSGTLSIVFAAYIAGILSALLVAGQLSDRWGRKPVLIPGILMAMVASVLFALATSVVLLILARFLTGIAVGIIVSAGMAMVVDVGGTLRKQQASLAASVAMVLGAGLGPMLAGSLAALTRNPIPIVFGMEFFLLLTALSVVVLMPLPSLAPMSGERTQEAFRLPSVGAEHRRNLLLGIAVFGPGITATSFVLSLGPLLFSRLLHVQSPLISGGTAGLMFLTATAVQFAVRKLPVKKVFILGAGGTALSMVFMWLSIQGSQAWLLIGAALLAGAGQGLGQLGGLTLIATNITDKRRAEANALLNVGGYIPAGLLAVATGYLIDAIGVASGAGIFSAFLFVMASLAVVYVAMALPSMRRID